MRKQEQQRNREWRRQFFPNLQHHGDGDMRQYATDCKRHADRAVMISELGNSAARNAASASLPACHHQQMLTRQNDLLPLIQCFAQLHNNSMPWRLRRIPLLLDRHPYMQRVTYIHRLDESQAIVSIAEGLGIYFSCRHAHCNAEDQCAMRHSLPKRLRLAPFRVHVVRVEVSRLSSMQHNVRLRNRSSQRLSRRTRFVIFKVSTVAHHSTPFHA